LQRKERNARQAERVAALAAEAAVTYAERGSRRRTTTHYADADAYFDSLGITKLR
jgi:hypothetical protein